MTPKEVVIVGGGLMGLSLAYNLAALGMKDVVLIEKNHIGSGASGRNTEIIRSAFTTPAWIKYFDYSLGLWKALSRELNYNVMFTDRGYLIIASSETTARTLREGFALQRSLGLDSRLLNANALAAVAPSIDRDRVRLALLQPGGGFARHDAAVWAYARAAHRLGVSILQHTDAQSMVVEAGKVRSVVTSRGEFETKRVVDAAGAHSGEVAQMAGVKIPCEVYRLHAFVTESLKPFLGPSVISLDTKVAGHQTSRGEFVGSVEFGEPPSRQITTTLRFLEVAGRCFTELLPILKGVSITRAWAGIVDMTPDQGPILGEVDEVEGLILDCGWGGYGFMGAPASGRLLAERIIFGAKSPLLEPFSPSRFKTGKLVNEKSLISQ